MINDSCYQDLANAIVARMAKDYEDALKGEIIEDMLPEETIKECEEFFTSDIYEMLTKLDGKFIMEAIRRKVANDSKE